MYIFLPLEFLNEYTKIHFIFLEYSYIPILDNSYFYFKYSYSYYGYSMTYPVFLIFI